MTEENGPLKLFIETLTGRQETRLLKASEYNTLLAGFGLTPDEEQRLADLAEHHINRSRLHSRNSQMTGAVAEMERAAILRPTDPEILTELGNLYLERCLGKQFNSNDMKKAVETADIILEQFPGHSGAIDILNRAREAKKLPIGWRRFKKLFILSGIILIIILTATIIYSNRDFIFRFIGLNIEDKSSQTDSAETRESRNTIRDFGNEKTVAINYTGSNTGFMEWDDFSAGWIRRDNAFAFSIKGKINSPSRTIESLVLTMEGKSSENEILFTRDYTLVNQLGPPLPPGHILYFNETFYLKQNPDLLDRVSLSLPDLEYTDAEMTLSPLEIPVYWETARPEGIRLKFYILGVEGYETFDGNLYYLGLGLENYSIHDIKKLESVLEIRDENDEIINTINIRDWNPDDQMILGMSRTRKIISLSLPAEMTPEQINFRSGITAIVE